MIDSSAWIFALRKDFLPVVKRRIDYLLKENSVITTGIIKLELLGGTRTKGEFQRLKIMLESLDSVDTDKDIWESCYKLAFNLRRKGITIPYTDIVIAACAEKTNATILHSDSHFDIMNKKLGIKVESFVDNVLDNVKNTEK